MGSFRFLLLISFCVMTPMTMGQSTLLPELEPGVSRALADQRKAVLTNINYRLELSVPAEQSEPILGSNTITFDLAQSSQPLLLDFRESPDKILSVQVNGQDSEYEFVAEHLIIPGSELVAGANRVFIEFIAGDSSLNRNPEFLYTLFVPDRARTAFPLFDQPNLKATYELSLSMPGHWDAISNGALAETVEQGDRKLLRFERSDAISSYLFSFVAGEFERITRDLNGRSVSMLHRESDAEKVARNVDAIFDLHRAALEWLEDYTGIDYPFQKFDFALIPSFQYGGMEHVGAIQYRADSLLLDESPNQNELLGRASLISHETAHMWFGDLVTMDWFDDVWTKEVFANFMAAKIVNPGFPEINHDLNFLIRHYPSAYAVDRTEGANPIRQPLPNLNEAGTLYGNIIYNKAPIMMRQLELLIGEIPFQEGMQEYLRTFRFSNATWPDLIAILDRKTDTDLTAWSEVWVNTAGRPHISAQSLNAVPSLRQDDPAGQNRVWPQRFSVATKNGQGWTSVQVYSRGGETAFDAGADSSANTVNTAPLFNADGYGYGLFPADSDMLADWETLDEVQKGSLLISLYENLLEGRSVPAEDYLLQLIAILEREDNQLLINLALRQLDFIYWSLLPEVDRNLHGERLEQMLWQVMLDTEDSAKKKIYFDAYRNFSLSADALSRLVSVWQDELQIEGLTLSENDKIALATVLAIKLPNRAEQIVADQLGRIESEDRRRRFQWISPALSADQQTRDEFFYSLQDEGNRQIESWVLGALDALHHPLRRQVSEHYLLPSLELLQEIQVTGDIFFPARWLEASLGNYNSMTAAATVRNFLAERPDYNRQLRLKILQAADDLFRAERLRGVQ